MRHLVSVAFLTFLGTFAVAVIPKDFSAKNTQQSVFAQQNPSRPTARPTTTPTPTNKPTTTPTPTPTRKP